MLANVAGSLAMLLVGALFGVLLVSDRFVRRLDDYARAHAVLVAIAIAVVLIAAAVALSCLNTAPLNSGPASVVHGG